MASIPDPVGGRSGNARSPDEVIRYLLQGNGRYVDGVMVSENPPGARATLVQGQSPMAAIVRCADSRVAPEIIFDQPLGNLFVCSVAGNIPTPEIIGSLEYGVSVLGITLIVIMAHSSCGAVTAAVEDRSDLPPALASLVDLMELPGDCDRASASAIDEAAMHNASAGVDRILSGSSLLAKASALGTINVVAAFYSIETGRCVIQQA